MEGRANVSLESDRALVEGMLMAGEPPVVVEDYIECLDLGETEREELRRVARSEEVPKPAAETPWPPADSVDIASGDPLEMNPLTSQPQRSKPR